MKKRNSPIHGVLLVDKPVGVTSFDVVRQVSRTLGTRKCGHTGTLDPFASGLLCLCFGEATKMVQYLMAGEKEYVAELQLGVETDSCDCEGTPVNQSEVPADIESRIRSAIPGFIGDLEQTPPIYSAVKVNGKRLYEYARNGEEVEIPSRIVHIKDMELNQVEGDQVEFTVACGKGTYIRSLGRDLARACDTTGHLTGLRRTRLGTWSVEHAVSPESTAEELMASMMDSVRALMNFPQCSVNEELSRRIGWGQRIPEDELPQNAPMDETMVVRDSEGSILAVARLDEGCLRVERGFGQPW